METTAKTLNQLVTYLTEEKKSKDTTISEILLSNHPAFIRLKDVTNTAYRIFFTNLEELLAWLSSRGYTEDSSSFDWEDAENNYIFSRKYRNTTYILTIAKDIFDKNDKLKVVRNEDWDDSKITIESYSISEPNDEIPF